MLHTHEVAGSKPAPPTNPLPGSVPGGAGSRSEPHTNTSDWSAKGRWPRATLDSVHLRTAHVGSGRLTQRATRDSSRLRAAAGTQSFGYCPKCMSKALI